MQKYVARAAAKLFSRARFQFATVTSIKGNP